MDSALSDEADYDGHQPINQGGSPGTQHPEDRVAPSDRPMNDEANPDFPVRANITVEKPGGGAILIQTIVENGYFNIEDISYFAKPDLAHAQTAEKDWARQSLYAGPPFGNLDPDLQGFLDRYLEERGVNADLAGMIPDYVQVKEQKEYVSWLESKFPFRSIGVNAVSNGVIQISRTSLLLKWLQPDLFHSSPSSVY